MSLDDVCLWPDGTWCFYENLFDMNHMSDDFEMVAAGSAKWFEVTDGSVDVEVSDFGPLP